MTRRDYAVKWLFYSLATLLLVVVQDIILNHISLWGAHPFILPLIAALATMWESNEGVIFALVFGLLTDLTTKGPIPCFYMLAFFVICAASMLIIKHLIMPGFFCGIVLSVLSIILCDLLQILFLSYNVGISLSAALLLTAKELISVVCMPLIYFPFGWLHNRTKTD